MIEDEFTDGFDALIGPAEVFADLHDHFSTDFGVVGVVGLGVAFPEAFDGHTEAADGEVAFVGGLVETSEGFANIMEQRCPADVAVVLDLLDGKFGVLEEAHAVIGRVLVVVVLNPDLR